MFIVACLTRKRIPHLASSLCAETGEVLLVDGRAVVTTTTTSTRAVTTTASTGTVTTATTSTTATATATGSITTAAGSLDEAHVNLKEVLLLALLLTLALFLLGALDVSILLLIALQRLGLSPLGVDLGTLVRGTGLLDTKLLVLLLSQFGEVSSIGLVLVAGLLLSGGLRLVLVSLGDGLTGLLIGPFLLATGGTPALVDLLVGVTVPSLVFLQNATRRRGIPYP